MKAMQGVHILHGCKNDCTFLVVIRTDLICPSALAVPPAVPHGVAFSSCPCLAMHPRTLVCVHTSRTSHTLLLPSMHNILLCVCICMHRVFVYHNLDPRFHHAPLLPALVPKIFAHILGIWHVLILISECYPILHVHRPFFPPAPLRNPFVSNWPFLWLKLSFT